MRSAIAGMRIPGEVVWIILCGPELTVEAVHPEKIPVFALFCSFSLINQDYMVSIQYVMQLMRNNDQGHVL